MKDAPTGREFLSILTTIIKYEQPELQKRDPTNPLLKLALEEDGSTIEHVCGFTYPTEFGKKFHRLHINQAVYQYHGMLQAEINKLKQIEFAAR